jgi:hypothetical protein
MDSMPSNIIRSGAQRADESEPSTDELSLDAYLDRITQEIQERVEHQREVARTLVSRSKRPLRCHLVDCPCRRRMRSLLLETIHVIEETRSSFKCKKLGVIRKKLIDSLEDL